MTTNIFDLQKAFHLAVQQWTADRTLQGNPEVQVGGQTFTLREMCGRLWSCPDQMPDDLVALLDGWDARILKPGASYAAGARHVVALMVESERIAAVAALRSGLPPITSLPESSPRPSPRGSYRRRR